MILILGVTGTGKGKLAFRLADDIGAEIISVDSMKVYRRMDIGTAKPPKEAQQRVQYHLIDVVEPGDPYSVGLFLDGACSAIEQVRSRGKPIVAVGGTALYIKALLYGLFDGPGSDEQIRTELRLRAEREGLEKLYQELEKVDSLAAESIHPNDAKRIIRALEVYRITGKTISSLQQQWKDSDTTHNWTIIGLRREKADVSGRINRRVRNMIETGLVDEVKGLLAEDRPLSKQARCAIGYAVNGRTSLEDAIELTKKNTRRLAKGQRTWFKTFKNVRWLDVRPDEPAEEILPRTKALAGNIG